MRAVEDSRSRRTQFGLREASECEGCQADEDERGGCRDECEYPQHMSRGTGAVDHGSFNVTRDCE